jgi:hypothetical protein
MDANIFIMPSTNVTVRLRQCRLHVEALVAGLHATSPSTTREKNTMNAQVQGMVASHGAIPIAVRQIGVIAIVLSVQYTQKKQMIIQRLLLQHVLLRDAIGMGRPAQEVWRYRPLVITCSLHIGTCTLVALWEMIIIGIGATNHLSTAKRR